MLGCGISLAIAASYLSKSVRQTTGKKQNTCLLIWHIVNVFIIAGVYMTIAVLQVAISLGGDDNLMYYIQVAWLVALFAVFYTDCFLLWLLYRFMRPQETLISGNTIASATLFAHDPSLATENLKIAYSQ